MRTIFHSHLENCHIEFQSHRHTFFALLSHSDPGGIRVVCPPVLDQMTRQSDLPLTLISPKATIYMCVHACFCVFVFSRVIRLCVQKDMGSWRVTGALPDDHVYHQPRSGEERSYVTISDVVQNQSQSRLHPQTKIETDCLVSLCSCVSLLL